PWRAGQGRRYRHHRGVECDRDQGNRAPVRTTTRATRNPTPPSATFFSPNQNLHSLVAALLLAPDGCQATAICHERQQHVRKAHIATDILMKAAVVSVPLRDGLLKKPDWLDHQTAVGLTFAVKTFAASLRRTTPTLTSGKPVRRAPGDMHASLSFRYTQA